MAGSIPAGTITSLLTDARAGGAAASETLWGLVYEELRGIAVQKLRGYRGGVLQPTALVNAAFERLLGRNALDAENRRHLFYLFSRAMNDVYADHLRKEGAQKRGGGRARVPLMEVSDETGSRTLNFSELNQALCELRAIDSDAADLIQLRFFGGLSLQAASETLGLTFGVGRRRWDYAKAWLHQRLSASQEMD